VTLVELFLVIGVAVVVTSVLSVVVYWAWIELGSRNDD